MAHFPDAQGDRRSGSWDLLTELVRQLIGNVDAQIRKAGTEPVAKALTKATSCRKFDMPLSPVDAPARDEGFEIGFAMTDGTKQVRCYAQEGALDAVEAGRTTSAQQRLERFARHRAAFEFVASSLYDAGLPLRITSAHLDKLLAFTKRRLAT